MENTGIELNWERLINRKWSRIATYIEMYPNVKIDEYSDAELDKLAQNGSILMGKFKAIINDFLARVN